MRIINLLKQEFKLLIILVSLNVFSPAFNTLAAILLAKSVDYMINKDLNIFYLFILLTGLSWLMAIVCSSIFNVLEQKYIQKLMEFLRLRTINNLKNDIYIMDDDFKYSKFVNMVTNDISLIEEGISRILSSIYIISNLVFVTIALLSFNILIFLISFIISLAMLKVPKLFEQKISNSTMLMSKKLENMQKQMFNWINGIKFLYDCNAMSLLDNVTLKESKSVADSKIYLTKQITISNFSINLLNIIGQIIILISTGYLALNGIVSFGVIISVMSLSGQLLNSIQEFGEKYTSFFTTKSLLSHYEEDKIININKIDNLIFENRIQIKGLKYSYGNRIINFPNITFKKNKKYILTGKSGVGKTTLLNILAGRYKNYCGCIQCDDIPYSKYNISKNTAYVSQHTYIFNATIKENIILNKKYDPEIFNYIVKSVDLDSVIRRLEEGENTLLDLNNFKLSGGEIQRIGIARALYQDKKIFLIDEGTSNIDRKTASVIENMLFKNKELTVIMVTHSISEELKNAADDIIIL
ncbi:ATP-binding cassette subfamily B protein [Peptoniphilus olsenii]|uniref:ATP-binding cassette subfamily B protein n=1 Tax=Peptoniphilus olsenii TaxID=411570 RepID=A0ABV2JB58_9FIRM